MSQHRDAARLRTAAAAVTLAVTTAASCTACGWNDGPSEREYALPDGLCGLDVPRNLYDPLFPPGTAANTESFLALPEGLATLDKCAITLDGEEIAWSETSGRDTFRAYMGIRERDAEREGREFGYEMADGTPVAGEYEAMAWPGFAIAGTSCEPGVIIASFTVGIWAAHPEDEEESLRVMSELIQPYMKAAVESSQCTPGPNEGSEYSDAYQD